MAELIMKLYIRVLSIKSASIHEEALMGVGHLANGKKKKRNRKIEK